HWRMMRRIMIDAHDDSDLSFPSRQLSRPSRNDDAEQTASAVRSSNSANDAECELFISELTQENDESASRAPRFSRACRVCFTETPLRRAVFSACGHTLCRTCAEKLRVIATDEQRKLFCPLCRKEGGFVPLFEDRVEDDSEGVHS
ncbi:hypothetical protein PENTCL1PPCAC_24317, partial [Pristionchus entomophagus]